MGNGGILREEGRSSSSPSFPGGTTKSIREEQRHQYARPSMRNAHYSTTMHRGAKHIPPWGPSTILGSAHRSSAKDGYAGALYIPLRHCPYWGLQYTTARHYWTHMFIITQNMSSNTDKTGGLAQQRQAGLFQSLTMGWELLRVFSKPSFRSLEPAGSSSGAQIRDR